ncbi:sugar transferase [Haliangium ochraceum]|uniref:Undecaprenyl-phosphate galactose phosphotransferase n=1 Tax=Haliangium ochraceum (strain DSM 14365 / JCM 11303 / SMP-2) TaxID=502025 RepID=D0LXI6_HALO1|nr:sugar transferase [Haliangium ochraceum]ACY17741.1 Undecaprenyl-phosphate galactose phosphotransferase [Haliangium ochraceum DSM 14365]
MGNAALKRLLDLGLASAALVLGAPLIAGVAGLVRVRLGAPVLFRQVRPGLGGGLFTMYKFRTMRDALDADGEPLPDEQRLTAFGKRLRESSLDELPELFNVLRGDMSLVGPRPLLVEYLPRYSREQARRHQVKPGITGWAQIHGRNALTWEEKFALDCWYVDHQSLLLDLYILARTLAVVVGRRGIEHAGSATMPVFQGSPPPS